MELTNMKLTYMQVIQSISAVETLLNADGITFKIGLGIKKNADALNKVLKDYQAEEMKLAQKYFEKDENGNFIQVENGGYKLIETEIENYGNDHNDLMSFETEVPIYKISFNDIADVKIKPAYISSLEFMLIEED